MNYSTPELEKAVDDCTEALRIDPKYNRALMRRATALGKLERLEESVRGNASYLHTQTEPRAHRTIYRLDCADDVDKIPR